MELCVQLLVPLRALQSASQQLGRDHRVADTRRTYMMMAVKCCKVRNVSLSS